MSFFKQPDYGTSSRSSSSKKPSSSTPALRPNLRRRFPKALTEGKWSTLSSTRVDQPVVKTSKSFTKESVLEGPRLAEEYSTSSAFALETSFCRARPVAFNEFFGNGLQSGVDRQAAKITGAGNGTGGRDARKRKKQSIRFLRRLIPILLSGSPLGSAN